MSEISEFNVADQERISHLVKKHGRVLSAKHLYLSFLLMPLAIASVPISLSLLEGYIGLFIFVPIIILTMTIFTSVFIKVGMNMRRYHKELKNAKLDIVTSGRIVRRAYIPIGGGGGSSVNTYHYLVMVENLDNLLWAVVSTRAQAFTKGQTVHVKYDSNSPSVCEIRG